MFPFNFNSIHRNINFLFGKIFNSIIEKKKIEIGNTYFYRDIIHPKFVVKNSIQANENQIIGSGRMIFVNDFIRDLYKYYGLDYSEFIYENFDKFNEYEKNNEYYLKSENCLLDYKELLDLTIEDINTRL
jgi:nucleoside-diphosphate-sugar epimerase